MCFVFMFNKTCNLNKLQNYIEKLYAVFRSLTKGLDVLCLGYVALTQNLWPKQKELRILIEKKGNKTSFNCFSEYL